MQNEQTENKEKLFLQSAYQTFIRHIFPPHFSTAYRKQANAKDNKRAFEHQLNRNMLFALHVCHPI